MVKKMFAVLGLAVMAVAGTAGVASADPGPGGSGPAKVCAPGQHAGSGQLPWPGFKPPACLPGTGSK
jgi:hypothetical protein